MAPILKAIIFDVDGTLAETEEEHRRAFNAAFRAFGLPWQWNTKTYRELLAIGGGRERLETFFKEKHLKIDKHLIFDLHKEKSRIYTARIATGCLRARPGVLRLIAEARAAGIYLACATPSQRSNVVTLLRSLLGEVRAETIFTVLGCGEDVSHKKPAPDIYLWVLKQLGLQAESCVVIEDTSVGLVSATKAGLPTIITLSTYSENINNTQNMFSDAIAVLDHLGELYQPFTILAGQTYGHGSHKVVDISLLRQWLACYRQGSQIAAITEQDRSISGKESL